MIGLYRFGCIQINENQYQSDVVIYPNRVDDQWWREDGHQLRLRDLADVLKEQPDTLVVGTGYFGRMRIDPEVQEGLKARGITLIAERTKKACEEYNRLEKSGKVIAALHLTC